MKQLLGRGPIGMMTPYLGSICLALVIWITLSCGPAQATDLPIQGGPGGGEFRDDCGAGRYLVGVSIRSGGWVDAIFPLCAVHMAQGQFAKWKRGPRHGGTGGSPLLKDAVCPPDHFVIGLKFGVTQRDKHYIDWVAVQCIRMKATAQSFDICLHTGGGCSMQRLGLGPFWQTCPNVRGDQEWATGIRGSSGAFVDALGLICGRAPR